jgi:hypothetical protein
VGNRGVGSLVAASIQNLVALTYVGDYIGLRYRCAAKERRCIVEMVLRKVPL